MRTILTAITLIFFFCICYGASQTLKYENTPKLVDANGNETNLDNFTITQTANNFLEYKAFISTGTTNTSLPIVTNTRIVELESSRPLTLGLWTSGGVFIASYTSCSNFVLNATSNQIYKVSISTFATSSNIIWRQGK